MSSVGINCWTHIKYLHAFYNLISFKNKLWNVWFWKISRIFVIAKISICKPGSSSMLQYMHSVWWLYYQHYEDLGLPIERFAIIKIHEIFHKPKHLWNKLTAWCMCNLTVYLPPFQSDALENLVFEFVRSYLMKQKYLLLAMVNILSTRKIITWFLKSAIYTYDTLKKGQDYKHPFKGCNSL